MKDRPTYLASGAGQQSVEPGSGTHAVAPFVESDKPRASTAKARLSNAFPGLTFTRFFTEAGVDPFDEIEWEIRTAAIGNERGEMVFEQRDVEIPKSWSQQATNIVVSKYFRGQIGTPER